MCGFYEPEKHEIDHKIWNIGFDDDNIEEDDG